MDKLKSIRFSKYNVVFSFLIYVLIAVLITAYFSSIVSFYNSVKPITLTEGVLQPKTNISANSILNPDPLLTFTDDDQVIEIRKKIASLIFSSLFVEEAPDQVIGDIVKSYTFENSSKLNLVLYDNIFWHDGERLTAQDVEFTFRLIQNIGQRSLYYGALNSNNLKIDIVDDFELNITLLDSAGPNRNEVYIHELTFPILPKHILSNNYSRNTLLNLSESDFAKSPIGSGPLKYVVNRGGEVEFSRFSEYFKGPIRFDKYIIRFYRDIESVLYDYRLKNIDLFTRHDIGEIDKGAKILIDGGMLFENRIILNQRFAIYFNLASKANDTSQFNKSTLIRRGLLNVINRNSIISNMDSSREVLGPIDQDSPFFSQEVMDRLAYNPSAFTTLVESLGYKKNEEGFYTKDNVLLHFELTYLQVGSSRIIASNIEEQLKQVGVKVNLKPYNNQNTQNDTFSDIVSNRNYDVLLIAISHSQDPDVYSEWHSSQTNPPGLNLSGFSSRVADKYLEDGRTTSGNERRQAYTRFQRTFFEESPAIYLVNPSMQIFSSSILSIPKSEKMVDTYYIYHDINNWSINVD